VRYWLHCAHLMVEGQKMAKSLGNFYTLRDLLEKGWTGREVRYALLTVNYRLPLNFTFDGLAAARAALGRIDEWVDRLTDIAARPPNRAQTAGEPERSEPGKLGASERALLMEFLEKASDESASHLAAEGTGLFENVTTFFDCLDDDLNISGAMGHFFDLIRLSNRAMDLGQIRPEHARLLLKSLAQINQVLAIDRDAAAVPPEVLTLVEERQQARAAKNWGESDRLRDEIAALGWSVKDTKDGPKLTPR
jgi:cysteinyl-tRNA synthetase